MLSEEQLHGLATDYFADQWAVDKAVTLMKEIESEVRKQDDALIQQMHVALKNCRATGALDDQAHALASTDITAARARLGEP